MLPPPPRQPQLPPAPPLPSPPALLFLPRLPSCPPKATHRAAPPPPQGCLAEPAGRRRRLLRTDAAPLTAASAARQAAAASRPGLCGSSAGAQLTCMHVPGSTGSIRQYTQYQTVPCPRRSTAAACPGEAPAAPPPAHSAPSQLPAHNEWPCIGAVSKADKERSQLVKCLFRAACHGRCGATGQRPGISRMTTSRLALCTPGARWWRRKRCTLPKSQQGSTTALGRRAKVGRGRQMPFGRIDGIGRLSCRQPSGPGGAPVSMAACIHRQATWLHA